MTKETISPKARKIVDQYLSLPIGTGPSCPYFNNRRKKARGALRVLVGKGSPREIAEECEIQAVQSRVKASSLPIDKLKKFLVEKNLGVDCSGFAYHVLNAMSHEITGKSLRKHLFIQRNGFFGPLISRIRPAENVNVLGLSHAKNSEVVNAMDARPGDIIVFLGTGKEKTYNHILVVSSVERGEKGVTLTYAHSYAWPSDGEYGHGVREGTISLSGDDILNGTWIENGETGKNNYTRESAQDAEHVSVRRMKFLA